MRSLFVIALLLSTSDAYACSCGGYSEDIDEEIRKSYEWYPSIFLGTAERVTMLPGDEELQETVFTVHKVWKGEIDTTITTTISLMCCICGYQFEKGITYLVFAAKHDNGRHTVSICSLTKQAGHAADYIRILDQISEVK